ncbi:hypothetical protein CRENBAI_011747 [Crenichthys baileyi]|uniref:Uncharacterized protein n=1 Tax=Crenichthys baileyi TaxID=28760 RepID=A0AAV9S878_9TELE
MLPACLQSGVHRYKNLNRMFPPNMDLMDGRQESARDRWVQQQMEEAMRHLPAHLEVQPCPLLLEQMECEAVQRPSPPSSLVARPDLVAKPLSSSRCKNRRHRASPTSILSKSPESCCSSAHIRSSERHCSPAHVRSSERCCSSAVAKAPERRHCAAQVCLNFLHTPQRMSEEPLLKPLRVPATPQPLHKPLRVSATPQLLRTPLRGFEDEPPPEPVPERCKKELVLILASEPRDEGCEEEAPQDPVSEGFKEQLVLVLASEGPPDSASVSEGPVGTASASEGSPGSASASEGSPGTVKAKPDSKLDSKPGSMPDSKPGSKPDSKPDSKPPEFHRVSEGSSMLHGRRHPPRTLCYRSWHPSELCACTGRPPELCACVFLLRRLE